MSLIDDILRELSILHFPGPDEIAMMPSPKNADLNRHHPARLSDFETLGQSPRDPKFERLGYTPEEHRIVTSEVIPVLSGPQDPLMAPLALPTVGVVRVPWEGGVVHGLL
jgi:hypothetical protein